MKGSPHVLIVGGRGKMGKLFGQAFKAIRCRVTALDKDDAPEPSKISKADVVMLSVPMKEAASIAESVAPHVREDALLFDINSLKTGICAVMKDRCPGEVLGTHPMFGPTVSALRRQKMVICPVRTGARASWLLTAFGEMGLDLVETSPEHHDRMMAVVQVLTHFSKIVLGEAWKRSGIPIEDTLKFISPVYRLELAVTGRLFAQDPELYAEIEMANPFASEIRENLIKAANDVGAMLKEGNRDAFCTMFRDIQQYLHGFSEDAMELSDRVVQFMVEQPGLQKH